MRVISNKLPASLQDACLQQESEVMKVQFMQDVTVFVCKEPKKEEIMVFFVDWVEYRLIKNMSFSARNASNIEISNIEFNQNANEIKERGEQPRWMNEFVKISQALVVV